MTEDGTYVSDIESSGRRFFTMLGTLVQGRVSVGVFIRFVPATVAGVPNTEPVTVTLIKKGRRQKARR